MLDVDDLIFAAMDASGGRIEGRTKLQKLVFFLSEILGVDAGYRPHFYGPYSSLVSATTESQVSRGAFHEMVEEFAGTSGFVGNDDEFRRYVYALTNDGRTALEWRRRECPEEFRKAVSTAQKALCTGANYRVLSYAAKLYYILRDEGGTMTHASARKRAGELGWDMSPEDTQQGVDLLVQMKLVHRQKAQTS